MENSENTQAENTATRAYGETAAYFTVLELLAMGVNQNEIERRSQAAGHKVAQSIVSAIKLKKSNRPSWRTVDVLQRVLDQVKRERVADLVKEKAA
jgi:hypothetical protein